MKPCMPLPKFPSHPRASSAMAFVESDRPAKRYEYAMLVTDLPYDVCALAQLYRDRADAENVFNELKNQWGWGGYVTHDIKRCRLTADAVALTILERLLQSHRRRFRSVIDRLPVVQNRDNASLLDALDTDGSGQTIAWLAQCGRFANHRAETNTLAATNDAQAAALSLRDRASRSRCGCRQVGPLVGFDTQRLARLS